MQHFTSYKIEISDFLINFLKKKQQEFENSYFSKDIFERLAPLATTGKMLRGSLLINTYEKLSEQSFSREVLKTAAALELAQTSFLIHDDIIDQDELRRGQETLHSQYNKYGKKAEYQNPEHFGESLAICAGDIIFFSVYELLAGNLVKLFSQQLSITALGEMHDVELSLMSEEEIAKENILQMYADKTASYSVCLPLMAGAVLAKQNKKVAVQLNELGRTLGLIFQIKDDELGLFGDESKTGKPVGADIREGKKTLYYYYLLKKTGVKAQGNDVKKILNLIEEQGIKQEVERELSELVLSAESQIDNLSVTIEMKKMIHQFIDRIANRVR